MLTIKHISDGREFIFEAEYFVTERRDDGNLQFIAFDAAVEDYKQTWCAAPSCDGMPDNHLYVMNRHGKTVGTYHFTRPTFS